MKCRLKLTLLRLIWFNIASRNVKQPSVYCKPLGDPCQAGKKKLEGDGPVHVFDQVQTQDWRQTLWDRTGDLRMYRRGTKTKICLWIQPSHCVSMGLFLKRRPLAVCVCACMYVCVCVCVWHELYNEYACPTEVLNWGPAGVCNWQRVLHCCWK